MRTKELKRAAYEAPRTNVIGMRAEVILCASVTTPWYQKGGEGDFDYSVENEDTWA